MIRLALAATLATLALGTASAQTAPGQGPLDISADRGEVFDSEGRVIYTGDVNVVRGDTRLRADVVEAFFNREDGGGFSQLERIVAVGNVYYVTPTEIARGDYGVYDLLNDQITLTGSVVLTQGCNVSTGARLDANLSGGQARLSSSEGNQRVRSVFFSEEDQAEDPRDCPRPTIPGAGPRPFDG